MPVVSRWLLPREQGNRERGTGNGERGTGDGEQGAGTGEQWSREHGRGRKSAASTCRMSTRMTYRFAPGAGTGRGVGNCSGSLKTCSIERTLGAAAASGRRVLGGLGCIAMRNARYRSSGGFVPVHASCVTAGWRRGFAGRHRQDHSLFFSGGPNPPCAPPPKDESRLRGGSRPHILNAAVRWCRGRRQRTTCAHGIYTDLPVPVTRRAL